MTDAKFFVEGGGDSKELQARCREGFKKLLGNSGFTGRLPRIIALLVDSEDLVVDGGKPWDHLKSRDNWD